VKVQRLAEVALREGQRGARQPAAGAGVMGEERERAEGKAEGDRGNESAPDKANARGPAERMAGRARDQPVNIGSQISLRSFARANWGMKK
jgi:hypothetical protein